MGVVAYQFPEQVLPYGRPTAPTTCTYSSAPFNLEQALLLEHTHALLFQVGTLSDARFVLLTAHIGEPRSQLDREGYSTAKESSEKQARALAAQWGKFLLDPQAPYDADALTETVDPLFDALSRLGAGAIDLRGLSPERANGVHLAVVLRATFSTRELTPGWDEALEVARKALQRDHLDETDALVGMI
ncbi:hypothetical protein LH462_11410 [Laribacter hongkongensis]|uniref:Uncharacterized protein n=1 Tax=Laribacter hongkongensis TaxID=168471 RepID=A0ABD4SUU0_9NEIS|nr:hypothetical protein [Laribacter hongkongensis]MCG9027008.1 hypothetical protein [Laribacter hongkongensis]MCG9104326.1 hypothetical protein [Laribacter hongkongensis]MCG9114131.1 hypothetical protein [Laribacter hongkongensis]